MRRKKNLKVLPGGLVSYRIEDDWDPMVVLAGSYGHPDNLLTYRPDQRQLVPQAGAWVMVKRTLPPLAGRLDEVVVPGCAVFAKHRANADAEGFTPDGKYVVDVTVPHGLSLWPYEYFVLPVSELLACWQLGELVFHPAAEGLRAVQRRRVLRAQPRHRAGGRDGHGARKPGWAGRVVRAGGAPARGVCRAVPVRHADGREPQAAGGRADEDGAMSWKEPNRVLYVLVVLALMAALLWATLVEISRWPRGE